MFVGLFSHVHTSLIIYSLVSLYVNRLMQVIRIYEGRENRWRRWRRMHTCRYTDTLTQTHTYLIGVHTWLPFAPLCVFLDSFGREWTWTMFLSANSATLIAGRPRCVRQKSFIFRQKSRTFLDKGPTFLQKSSVCWPTAFQSHSITQSHTGHDNTRFQWTSRLVGKLS